MELTFEPFRMEHLKGVRGIYNDYVVNTTVTFDLEAVSAEEMKSNIVNPDPRFKTFVILDRGELIGYILLTQYKKKRAYDICAEVTIYLKAETTGQGIGFRALQFIESYAVQNGFQVLIATICSENDRSIRLFERNGYEQCAYFRGVGYKFGRKLDIVCFQKQLG
ncbi:GNAT family N-acetyltransferase [Paenibacillus humicola]|uniref:GNAT family N-acetyltransferase n=1 Tax=Paenibacillus humicola TaxID=3110540 RepID=UPI00237BDD4F|nr:GNAT family N-acetyltransferase [Paenibacillus humicola]